VITEIDTNSNIFTKSDCKPMVLHLVGACLIVESENITYSKPNDRKPNPAFWRIVIADL